MPVGAAKSGILASGGSSVLELRATYTSADYTFSPVNDAGGEAGDLMIVFIAGGDDGTTDRIPTSISGWTKGPSAHSTGGSPFPDVLDGVLWGRILDGTETADVTFMNSGHFSYAACVLLFRTGMTSFAFYDKDNEGTSGNPASQTVEASGGTAPLVVLGAYASQAALGTLTFSPTQDDAVTYSNSGTYTALRYKVYPGSPADVTVDMNDQAQNNVLCSCYIGEA